MICQGCCEEERAWKAVHSIGQVAGAAETAME